MIVVLHSVHFGLGSLLSICPCVMYVWPIRSLVIALSCSLLSRFVECHASIVGCICLSAVVCSDHCAWKCLCSWAVMCGK